MGLFKLPKGILNKLIGLYRKFWWEFNGDASKISEIEWSKLGLTKKSGALDSMMWRASI